MSYTDDQQVENLKRWWRENGRSIIAGVAIAVIALIGWQQWQNYQRERGERSSDEYTAFLREIRKPDAGEGAVQRGEQLIEQYGGTAYGPLTAFWLAQYFVEHNELDKAAAKLRWALENADTDAERHVARLRLARVLMAQQKNDEALALVANVPSDAFASQYQELRGDILSAQGKGDEAVAAYRAALEDSKLDGSRRSIIELKLNDLGATSEGPVS